MEDVSFYLSNHKEWYSLASGQAWQILNTTWQQTMKINLTEEQLQRIIKALQNDFTQSSDKYLISYLQYVAANSVPATAINLDEIPF